MKIVVVARQSNRFWFCIDKSFQNCPSSGTFQYAQSSDLKSFSKSEWTKVGQCSKKVKVINTAAGKEKNTFPFKLERNNSNNV